MLPIKFGFIWRSCFREDFKKSANQKQELPVAAMFVNESGQNAQSLERTFHRCFLPSFSLFGWGVAEERIKMWKVNRRRTPNDGKSSRCLWQGELKKRKDHNVWRWKSRSLLGTGTKMWQGYIFKIFSQKLIKQLFYHSLVDTFTTIWKTILVNGLTLDDEPLNDLWL